MNLTTEVRRRFQGCHRVKKCRWDNFNTISPTLVWWLLGSPSFDNRCISKSQRHIHRQCSKESTELYLKHKFWQNYIFIEQNKSNYKSVKSLHCVNTNFGNHCPKGNQSLYWTHPWKWRPLALIFNIQRFKPSQVTCGGIKVYVLVPLGVRVSPQGNTGKVGEDIQARLWLYLASPRAQCLTPTLSLL